MDYAALVWLGLFGKILLIFVFFNYISAFLEKFSRPISALSGYTYASLTDYLKGASQR